MTLAFPGHELVASFAAYCACIGFSYVLQKKITFRSTGMPRFEFTRFVAVSVLGLLLSTAIVHVSTANFGWSPYVSYMIVIATIPFISYILFSRYVFD